MAPCTLKWTFFLCLLLVLFYVIYKYQKTTIRKKKLDETLDDIDDNLYYSKSDAQGVITDVSKEMCEFTGYTRAELIGNNHAIFKHKHSPKVLFRELWTTINAGNAWEGEIQNCKKDGTSYWLHVRITPCLDKASNIIGFKALYDEPIDDANAEKIATTDKLTQIHNRAYLERMYEKEFNRAQKYHQVFSIIMIDIDDLREVNDSHGYVIGDKTLMSVGQIIIENIRKGDYLGRWSGTEFLIICPNTFLSQALILGKKVNNAVKNFEFEDIAHLTCSVGVSESQVEDSKDNAIQRADKAMYSAKRSGKNKVSVFQKRKDSSPDTCGT